MKVIERIWVLAALIVMALVAVAATRTPSQIRPPGQPAPVPEVAVERAPETPSPNERVPLIYWATRAEADAYRFMCEANMQMTSNLFFRVETSDYTPSNYFQVQLENQIGSWVRLREEMERQRLIRQLNERMHTMDIGKIKMIEGVVVTLDTNTPPANPPAPPQ